MAWFSVFYLFLLRAVSLIRHGDIQPNNGPTIGVAQLRNPVDCQPSVSVSVHISNLSPGQPQRHGTQQLKTQLRLFNFNARSLFPERLELKQLVIQQQSSSPHLIAVSETWLSDVVPDGAVALPGYSSVFRTDREGHRGGGVLLLAKDGVKCQRRADFQVWPESVWTEVATSDSMFKSFVVDCV